MALKITVPKTFKPGQYSIIVDVMMIHNLLLQKLCFTVKAPQLESVKLTSDKKRSRFQNCKITVTEGNRKWKTC